MFDTVRAARGVIRSLRIYYGDRQRRGALDWHYARFVARGDLVFDIGSHVGDRVAAFRRLGARVVAVEPQPALAKTLRFLYGRDTAVTVVETAVGREVGTVALQLNLDNPTVSTASEAFIRASRGAPGWEGQQWTRTVEVPVTTLDALIARHGAPRFIKIDVEGFEAAVLQGLSRPLPALSLEYVTAALDGALVALDRLQTLGSYAFNRSSGESLRFLHGRWRSATEMRQELRNLPAEAGSGDLYARLEGPV